MIRTDLGIATAYAEAVSKGYTGTRDEFGQMFADFGKTAEMVTEDKKAVEQMKLSVEETKNSVDTTAAEFGQNVADKTAEAKAAITEHANTEKELATAAISEAKDAATGAITEAQTSATDAVASAKDSATAEIAKKGTDTLATIPEDYTALTKEVGSLKEDLGNKAPAIIKKALGKTIIINDSSNLPVKILSGTGKIIITGKNILDSEKRNEFIPFEAKAGTLFTLITNGELSEGGNIKLTDENGEQVWFAIDKGKTKVSIKISINIKGYTNLLTRKEGLKYCFSVGENDEYEEHMEQVITAPVDSEQLKAIRTNYPTTILTSENEISVEYVADTETYIEKRIKEENQSLQKQILEIQNALDSYFKNEIETESETETVIETDTESEQVNEYYFRWEKYIPESLKNRWASFLRR